MSIIDSNTTSNDNDSLYTGYRIAHSQSFTGDGQNVGSATFSLHRVGTPSGYVYAKLYEHSGTYGTSSEPGSLIDTSEGVDVSTISDTGYDQVELTFADPPATGDGTYYCIVVEYDGGNSTNKLTLYINSTSVHDGNAAHYVSSWTPVSTRDLWFVVTGAEATNVAYKSIGTVDSGDANSLTPGLPSGWEVGDFAVLYGFTKDAVTWGSTPSGWTNISQLTTSNSTYGSLWVGYRVLESGDSAPTLTYSETADTFIARIISFSGVDTSSPLDITPTTEQFTPPGNPYQVALTGVTTSTDGALAVYIYGHYDNYESASDWTERADDVESGGTDAALAVTEKSMPTAGGTGTCTVTFAPQSSGDPGTCGKLVLKPMGGGLSVEPGTIASTAALYNPTLIQDQFIDPGTIASTAALYSPEVQLMLQYLLPGTISSTFSGFNPQLNQQILPNSRASTVALYNPELDFTLKPNNRPPTASLYNPELDFTLTAGTITSSLTLYGPQANFKLKPGHRASTIALYNPELDFKIFPNNRTSTASLYDPTLLIQGGMQTLEPGHRTSTAALYGPEMLLKILLGTISSDAALYNPELDLSLDIGTISSTSAFYAPQLNLVIFPNNRTATAALYSATVILAGTEQTVIPSTISSSVSLYGPFVVTTEGQYILVDGGDFISYDGTWLILIATEFGPQNIYPGHRGSTASIYTPTVEWPFIEAGTVSSTAALYSPKLNLTVIPTDIDSTASVYDPELGIKILLNDIASTAALYNPELGLKIFPNNRTSTASLYDPTLLIQGGMQTLEPGHRTSTAALYDPELGLVIIPTDIDSTAALYDPELGLVIIPTDIDSTVAFYNPTTILKSQYIFPNTLTSSMVLGTITILGGERKATYLLIRRRRR